MGDDLIAGTEERERRVVQRLLPAGSLPATGKATFLAWHPTGRLLCGSADGGITTIPSGVPMTPLVSRDHKAAVRIWAAVGGRGTLLGPLLGALFLNGAKSFLTAAFPSAWLYVLGGIFVLVTLFLPRGFLGLADVWRRRRARAAAKTTVPS